MNDYVFSILGDTPNQAVNAFGLEVEIRSSAISIALHGIDVLGDQIKVSFKAELGPVDISILESLVHAHTGVSLPEQGEVRTSDGKQRVQVDPRTAAAFEVFSPNWCDRCTWYSMSHRVTEEELVQDSGLTYEGLNPFWIDVRNGRITQEHLLESAFGVKVYDNGVLLQEKTVFDESGDYTVDHEEGKVTLLSAPQGIVTATYNFSDRSDFIIAPPPGKTLVDLLAVEANFSTDMEMNDTAVFVVEVMVAPNTWFEVADRRREYKTMYDFVNEARRSYPEIPRLGGPLTNPRAMRVPEQVYRWDYDEQGTRRLTNTGMPSRIRIFLKDHKPYGGTKAQVAIYATVE